MGQRLTLQICEDTTILASAYYHWSAYTKESRDLVKQVIDFFEKNSKDFADDSRLCAIRALESTGAGFISDSECMEDVKNLYKDLEFKEAYSRNKGLLVVGKLDSSGTYLVRINITTKTIHFGAVGIHRIEDFKEDYPEEEAKIIKESYNYEQLKYSELDDFIKILTENEFVIFESDPDTVLECFYSMGLEFFC